MEDNRMINNNTILFKYGLHDSIIDKIFIQSNMLLLLFNFGIYKLNENGKETTKTSRCTICIEVEGLNNDNICEHIQIYKIHKNKIKEIEYEKFAQAVNSSGFNIDSTYLSCLENNILLEVYILKNQYQVKISECVNIELNFE